MMRILRLCYDDGKAEACLSEAIHPGKFPGGSIEMFCAPTGTGAEFLTPSSVFYFQELKFTLLAVP